MRIKKTRKAISNQCPPRFTAMWKVSKFGTFWSIFSVFGLNTDLRCKSPYSFRIQQNMEQKKAQIWTLSRSSILCNINALALII